MAVNDPDRQTVSGASTGRRFLVGTNVIIATALVVAIVAVAQAVAYKMPRRWDMTSSGVNSLSEATENLLRGLDTNIRLTSLYFETDREEEDQSRYRQAAGDLIDLYEATNRGKVASEWINPLKDHEKFSRLRERLRKKTLFAKEIELHQVRLDKYTGELDERMRSLVQSELDQIDTMGASIGETSDKVLAPLEDALRQMGTKLEKLREQIDTVMLANDPQYSFAVSQLRAFYNLFKSTLDNIVKYADEQVVRNPGLLPDKSEFLGLTESRYGDLIAAIAEETSELQDLEPLKLDEVLGQLEPTANAILVETDDDAKVIDFPSVWPPVQQGGGGRASFRNRAFKGEEKLTSAILRTTHKEQTAVVFVRYGGASLFMGGFMPGQPPPPYARMKQQIEDANFVVQEWDLKTSTDPPTIDPAPTRTIYVLLKPTPPQRGPMGQTGQEPPFGGAHREAVLEALGDSSRALFIAGWFPGPFGMIPSTYEYNDYLGENWGVKVDTATLLIETMNIAPGKYVVARKDFVYMKGMEVTAHDIVSGPLSRQLLLPSCAPLELSEPPPEGVGIERLVILPARDGVWGVKSLQTYGEQLRDRDYLTKAEGDLDGPFDLAVAATKGDAKIVVVSSPNFALDTIAFFQTMDLSGGRLRIRWGNPGNIPLLINSLHWLNDNMEFMNIGKPIDTAVLQIDSASTVKVVQVLTIFAWPTLALVCGGVVWMARRR